MENGTGLRAAIWRGKYLVLAGVVLGIICGVLAIRATHDVYEASAIVQVEAAAPTAADPFGVQEASQALAVADATLIQSKSFLSQIQPEVAGGAHSASFLASNISAKTITDNLQNTNLIEITGRSSTQADAIAVTQGVASAFAANTRTAATSRSTRRQQEIQAQIASLTSQINRLGAGAGNAARVTSLKAARAALTAELGGIIAGGTSQLAGAEIVGPAVGGGRVAPRPFLDLFVGALLGLLAGIAAAWLRYSLDRQIHSADDVRQLVDLPVLASVPLTGGRPGNDPLVRDAFDVLRTNVMFVSPESPPEVLTVTSARQEEGKTAVAEGLARAAAARGMKVLLIDGDLRTSALSSRLGKRRPVGLATLLEGGKEHLDWFGEGGPVTRIAPSLYLLEAGRARSNPPSLLARPEARMLVERARSEFDLIVFDAPPLALLTDATILTALSDASLVVARANRSTGNDIQRAVEALERTPAPIAGVVVLEPRSRYLYRYPEGRPPWRRWTGNTPFVETFKQRTASSSGDDTRW